jgi:hypothetical protein
MIRIGCLEEIPLSMEDKEPFKSSQVSIQQQTKSSISQTSYRKYLEILENAVYTIPHPTSTTPSKNIKFFSCMTDKIYSTTVKQLSVPLGSSRIQSTKWSPKEK